MKLIKYIVGGTALVLFFLFLDSSGIGFKKHLQAIREWADGDKKSLRSPMEKVIKKP